MGIYVPELGQAVFGNQWGEFEAENIGDAAIEHTLREIGRVFWNKNQREWDWHETPGLKGIRFQCYWWGDDDAQEASVPNLQIEGSDVEIRWYKHPGRGNTTSRKMSPDDWHHWLNLAMSVIRENDLVEERP